MKLISAGLTDIGQKRSTNQDSIYTSDEHHYYLVADGMGGHAAGDIASQMAVKLASEHISKLHASAFHQSGAQAISSSLCDSFVNANAKIYQSAQQNSELKGMGTTMVSAFFNAGHVYLSNVGDSRAYMIYQKEIFQLTKDHTLVQEKINQDIYDRHQAAEDRMKNVLVRTVGYEKEVEVDSYQLKWPKEALLLLCSDGLYGKVSDRDIIHLINKNYEASNQQKDNLNVIAKLLIDTANLHGGQDNISVVLVQQLL
jgi:protein phosphatase